MCKYTFPPSSGSALWGSPPALERSRAIGWATQGLYTVVCCEPEVAGLLRCLKLALKACYPMGTSPSTCSPSLSPSKKVLLLPNLGVTACTPRQVQPIKRAKLKIGSRKGNFINEATVGRGTKRSSPGTSPDSVRPHMGLSVEESHGK